MLQPTDEQAKWLLKNWSGPRTKLALAEYLLVSPTTLYRWAEQLGLSRVYPERASIWSFPEPRRHKRRQQKPPILPVLARPAFFVEENLLPMLVGSGRHWPLRDPESGPKS